MHRTITRIVAVGLVQCVAREGSRENSLRNNKNLQSRQCSQLVNMNVKTVPVTQLKEIFLLEPKHISTTGRISKPRTEII